MDIIDKLLQNSDNPNKNIKKPDIKDKDKDKDNDIKDKDIKDKDKDLKENKDKKNKDSKENLNKDKNKIELNNTIEEKKKFIISKLKIITNNNYLNNIYNLIKKHNIKYTLNKNGIFFNLNSLTNKQVNTLHNYINSILRNIKKFKDDNNNLLNIRNNISFTNKKKTLNIKTINIDYEFNAIEKDIIKFSINKI